jgi:putative transposase
MFEKKISKLKARIKHLINDLHNKVAYDLVMKYDTILLPTFEISNMVKRKKDSSKRKIRKISVRSMLSLCHYEFKLKLKWMAKKYGKSVINVNEAYTSKTFNGKIFNIGSRKVLKTKSGKIIDRDINGARNILLRFLSKFVIA